MCFGPADALGPERQRSGLIRTRRKCRKEHLKASQTWIQPSIAEQRIHGAAQTYPEWLQTCQHLQLINLKSHPRTAAPHTHAQQKRKRREARKGGPCQNSSAVSEKRRGGGRKRRMSPSAHLERAFIPAHPDAQRRQGGYSRSVFKFTTINDKSVASHPFMGPGVLVALLQAGRWRRKVAVGSGRETGFYGTELQPPARTHRSATETGGASDETIFLPLFSLDDTTEEEQFSPHRPRDAFTCIPENAASLRFAFGIGWRVFRHPCATRPREASSPKTCSSFTFKFIYVFILKKLFWNTNKDFHSKK